MELMTLKEYHNKLRIDMAALMLRDTMLPVSEVMERVGFVDLTHFGRTFHRNTGYTPSEYRRLYCWMLKSFPEYQSNGIGSV